MSPEWQQLFVYAVSEAKRLDLQFALGSGPGWCGTRGPWVTPELSMQHLVASATAVSGPSHFSGLLPRPQPRLPFFGEGTLTPDLHQKWRLLSRHSPDRLFSTHRERTDRGRRREGALLSLFLLLMGASPRVPALADSNSVPTDQTVPPGQRY